MSNIVGLIPAAGKGSRLAPFPCPKELFPVGYQDYAIGGQPERRPKVISQYLVEELMAAGAERIFIILGEGKHDIMSYYGAGRRFGTNVAYLYQEVLHGMPFALDLAYPWLKGETVLFGMPDTIVEPKDAFVRLVDYHQAQQADLTLGTFDTDTPWKFSPVDTDAGGRVLSVIDKPQETHLRNTWGICCWGSRFTELMHDYLQDLATNQQEVVLAQVFLEALRQELNVFALHFTDGQYMDIGTVEELDSALRRFHL
ncbi:MAG: sugar phosphate nucleotidyltransferase [Anaerolineae bacterium]|jgi:glucose-1-phosphate thymidylyltransferase